MTDSGHGPTVATFPRPMRRPRSRPRSTSAGWPRTSSLRTAQDRGADRSKAPFVIVQPPPNVTGALHIGHALTADIEDVMIRRARMLRRPTLWLPGLDHASIGAQVVLDRIIAANGESRASLGRERYLERMEAFVAETRETILRQSRRFGSSLDWSRTRFTMDDVSSKAVRTAFTRLYRDDLAYRTEALIDHWCPGCRTSVSDLEVVPTPETGTLWTVRYHLLDDDGRPDPDRTISVATTRPDTILGATSPWRSTLTTPATRPWWGSGSSSRSWIGRSRSSPIRSSNATSGRAVKITPAPRSGRPCDRPAPRPAVDHGHGRRREPERRRRTVRGVGSVRRATASWPISGARRPRRGEAPRDDHRSVPALERRHRAAPEDAVADPDEAAHRPGPRATRAAGRGS